MTYQPKFTYDKFNRLTSSTISDLAGTLTNVSEVCQFDSHGNVMAKDGVGIYDYEHATNPYAVTGMSPDQLVVDHLADQHVTYTGFDKVDTIRQSGNTLTVHYGIDRQRVIQSFTDGKDTRTKRYFTPLYETVTENGVTKKLHYLTSASGLFAIFVSTSNGGGTMYYTLKDHQGSLAAVVHGNTVERLSYDPWGRRRNTTDFGYDNITYTFDRGYTLHEHYDEFDLINMNGRVYDPATSSFLSADRFVQDPLTAQGFNRYAYCLYNPLRYVDPTGWLAIGGGRRSSPDDPPRYTYVEGHGGYELNEVTIIADNPSLSNMLPFDEFWYTPNITSGGFDNGWGGTNNSSASGRSGGGGGGNGNHGGGIKYMLLDYHQKYHHHRQTDVKGCKIATARSYYQYFSGIDKGEADFSTIANGMIAVNKDTYLFEYYEACGLNVNNGMNVNIIEIGQQLEEGHPYSIVLKGERASDINHVVTMVGIYKENADSALKVFIKDPIQENGQYYEWVDFLKEIKDAYFITGLKKHRL